jgi:hypothetical protein
VKTKKTVKPAKLKTTKLKTSKRGKGRPKKSRKSVPVCGDTTFGVRLPDRQIAWLHRKAKEASKDSTRTVSAAEFIRQLVSREMAAEVEAKRLEAAPKGQVTGAPVDNARRNSIDDPIDASYEVKPESFTPAAATPPTLASQAG